MGDSPVNATDPSGYGSFLDLVGFGLAGIGLGLTITAPVVTAPLWLTVAGITIGAVGVVIAVDALACDYNVGVAQWCTIALPGAAV